MFDFLTIKKGIGDLTSQVRKVRKETEKLKQRRDLLLVAPPTKDDVVRLLHQRIDQMAGAYPERVRQSLNGYLNGTVNELVLPHHSMAFLMPASAAYSVVNAGAIFEGLTFLLQAPFKEGVARAVAQMDWPADAISMDERDKELAVLNAKIEALEKEDEQLTSAAAEAGIIINF